MKNLQEIEPGLNLIQQAIQSCGDYDYIVSTDRPDLMPESITNNCIERPPELSRSNADISSAVSHALTSDRVSQLDKPFDTVVVLQPAVVARSRGMLEDMLSKYWSSECAGAVTVVKTHPWIWSLKPNSTQAFNSWYPGPYPRSQDSDNYFIEINSMQITSYEIALSGSRWGTPLMLYEIPEWSSIFDIDTPEDLLESQKLYHWAKPHLSQWKGAGHIIESIN